MEKTGMHAEGGEERKNVKDVARGGPEILGGQSKIQRRLSYCDKG